MARARLILFLAACLAAGVPAVAAERQSHYALTQHALDTYILPRIETFDVRTDTLSKSVTAFCNAPADAGRDELKSRFRDALLAWADAETVRIGPATQEGRSQRIAFWPDARGAVTRQLKQALARSDPALTDARRIAAQSAAVQGFPALELLLSDTATPLGAPGGEGAYRCKAATAIAANIAIVAHDVAEGWTRSGGWRDKMLRPGSDNPAYPSATAAAADVLRSIATSLQLIVAAELNPLNEEGKKAKALPRPYRHLGLSRDYLVAHIRACRALYDAARLDTYLDPDDPDHTAKTLQSLFDDALAGIASGTWTADGIDASESQEQTRATASKLTAARRLIATKVANAAEISLGFNELDGD